MIKHPEAQHEYNPLYRFNTDKQRWEYWNSSEELWVRSLIYGYTPSREVIVDYEKTWAEPFEED